MGKRKKKTKDKKLRIDNQVNLKEDKNISLDKMKKYGKRFSLLFLIWICIFAIGLVNKSLQNDTFYTIKIGKLILNNGIDMMDHFSFHTGLKYTYPHWLYDVFIYVIYKIGGLRGLYLSSIGIFGVLLIIVFKVNKKICEKTVVAAFATFICSLAISGFVTARAQLVSFLLFALEIYFIEDFLKNKKKSDVVGLFIISLLLCNIHVAVWPFYFIIYLPYLAEYIISFIWSKIRFKKDNKFYKFINSKFVFERNKNIKYLFIIMIFSLLTGFITPIGDTPFTYLIKTMMGNSQSYIQEHHMISWKESPFTIIIAGETIFLALISKVKLRDFFMIAGLVLMSIVSIRHLSLLSLIGTICFGRVFSMFLNDYNFDVDKMLLPFFYKRKIVIISFALVIIITGVGLYFHLRDNYVEEDFYPVEAVKYLKENEDISKMRIFNDYNFGSYLLYNDIPVFIDSRADLYTKEFSGFDYDILDDYHFIMNNYQEKFDFYGITHILVYKEENSLYQVLKSNSDYKLLYEDDYFVLYKKIGDSGLRVTFG